MGKKVAAYSPEYVNVECFRKSPDIDKLYRKGTQIGEPNAWGEFFFYFSSY